MQHRSLRLFQILLGSSLALYLFVQVIWNPESGLLPPSSNPGQWILAPVDLPTIDGTGTAAVFSKDFVLPEDLVKDPQSIIVTAAQSYDATLNGQPLVKPHLTSRWQAPRQLDVRNALKGGHNRLEIVVRNTRRPPALRVSGTLPSHSMEAVSLNTDLTWRVRSIAESKEYTPGELPRPRDFYDGYYAERTANAARIHKLEAIARLLAYLALFGAVYISLRSPASSAASAPVLAANYTGSLQHRTTRRWIYVPLLAILFFPFAVIRDPIEGWDAEGHIEHIRSVAAGHFFPLPDEGWQMYQPPAYYLVAALVYRLVLPVSTNAATHWQFSSTDLLALKAVQLLTPLCAILQILLVLRIIGYVFPSSDTRLFHTSAFVGLLPVQLYVSSFISNEVFSSLSITAALFVLLINVTRLKFRIAPSFTLGLLLAIACLSKYSGIMLVMTTVLTYLALFWTKPRERRSLAVSFIVLSSVVLVLAGPFYIRNLQLYGRTLPLNEQFVPHFEVEYFDLAFFMDPLRAGLGAVDKFNSRASSFLDGNYSAIWIDNSHKSHKWMRVFEVMIYFLAFLPTVLSAAGFCYAVKACTDSENGRAYFVLTSLAAIGVFSYVSFILQFGTFDTVKPFYLLSMIAPLTVFFHLGYSRTAAVHLPRYKLCRSLLNVLYASLVLYYALAPWLTGKGL